MGELISAIVPVCNSGLMGKQSEDKLNIAMLGHKKIPSGDGGVEVVVEELSVRMAKRGHNVTCYNRNTCNGLCWRSKLRESETYEGVVLKDVTAVKGKGTAAATASLFAGIEAAFGKYDVVHIHAEGPAFFCWIPKLLGKRVIVTVHGLDHQRAKWNRFASAYIKMGERNAVRFADEIIVLSANIQKYFQDRYGRETKLIPNGVNKTMSCKPGLITEKWGLTEDSYLLYLGRLVPEKGGQCLIEAFKRVDTDKKLVIAGAGSDTLEFVDKLKLLAECDRRIIFTDFARGKLKQELYSNSYVYVLPSVVEGMPISLLEAVSYGNCCLTSDIPECTEVVEDKALLFKKGDTENLREKLQYLCDNPGVVQEYKNHAEEIVTGKYDWDDIVEKTLKLYRSDKGSDKGTGSLSLRHIS